MPLGVGAKAPVARIADPTGAQVGLSAVLGGKPTLLIFYRGGWCPYCSKHLATLSEVEQQFLDMGWQIVGISPDNPEALAAMADKQHVAYRLFSDRAMEAASAFGLAFKVDAVTVEKYKGYNIDLPPVAGEPESRWLPVPAAYLVDADGTIRFAYTNADYRTRVDPAELIAAARAVSQ